MNPETVLVTGACNFFEISFLWTSEGMELSEKGKDENFLPPFFCPR